MVAESNWGQRQALGMSLYLVLEHPGSKEDLGVPNGVVLIPNPSKVCHQWSVDRVLLMLHEWLREMEYRKKDNMVAPSYNC